MAASDLELQLRIQADIRAALEELKRFRDGLDDQTDSADRANDKMGGLAGTVKTLVAAWASLATVKSLIRIADDYGQMAARIQLATKSSEEYRLVQDRLYESTKQTYRSLEEAQELYIQTADALRAMNYTTQGALDVGESLSLLFVTNATSADRASSAINAFSKALQTGKVDSQSWQSLLLATPTLVDAIAAATGKTAQEVRKLGASGKLALEDLTEGLRKSLDTNKKDAEGMQTSVGDALKNLTNAWKTYIGKADEGGRHTGKIVKAIELLTENLDEVVSAAAAVGGALALVWGAAQIAKVAAYAKAVSGAARGAWAAAKTMKGAGLLAASGWLGWNIGEYLYKEFAIVRKAGAYMAQAMAQYANYVRYVWESALAVFSDDTLAAASKRFKDRATQDLKILKEQLAYIEDEVSGRIKKDPPKTDEPPIGQGGLNNTGTGDDGAESKIAENENYIKSLERQAATAGKTAAEVRAYDLAQRNLTDAQRARAIAALELIAADEKSTEAKEKARKAAEELRREQEQAARQAQQNARTNAALEVEMLRAKGKETEAALAELRNRIAAQKQDFADAGNEAGIAFLDKLLPLGEAKIRLEAIQRAISDTLERQRSAEIANQTQQDAGTINEYQARERLLDIHRQTREELALIRPQLEEMAALGGEVGQQALEALQKLDEQSQQLATTCSLLQKTLSDGLTGGLEQALVGLAKGTMDLRGAITSLALSVQDALLKMAAQNIAQSMVSKIMSAFGQGGATLQSGAVAVGQSAVQMQAAGGSLTTGAAAVSAAAAQLAAASASMGASGAAGGMAGGAGSAGAAAGQGAGAAAGGGFSMGYAGMAMMAGSMFGSWLARRKASGGLVTGPGSGTSDSIPAWLSNGEYVIRASVTQQPGMLQALGAINQGGLEAFKRIKGVVKHSTGGLAGIPAPNFSAPSLGTHELNSKDSTTVENQISLIAVNNQEQALEALANAKGRAVIMDMFGKYGQEFRQSLGVNN